VRVRSDESNSRFDSSGGVAECDWASAECGPSCYGKRVIGFRFAIAVKARTCCALLDGCFHVCRRWKWISDRGRYFGILVAWTIGGFLLCSMGDFQGCSFSNSVLERRF